MKVSKDLLTPRRVRHDDAGRAWHVARVEHLPELPFAVRRDLGKPGLLQVLEIPDREHEGAATAILGPRRAEPDEIDALAVERAFEPGAAAQRSDAEGPLLDLPR